MVSAYKQADDMHALQDYIDAQFGGPGKGFFRIVKSPAEARKVINDGKLAVVLGVEVSEVLDCGQFNGTPKCNAAQIDAELDKLYAPASGRCSRCTSSTTRWAAPSSTAAPPACSSTPATSTPPASSGPPTTATTPTTTTRPPRSATTRPS